MRTLLEENFLHAAQNGNQEEIVKAVEAGVDVNVCDDMGRNALDKVARTANNAEAVEFLLANGIEVHKSLLTDNRAKLKEVTKNVIVDTINQRREKLKAELKKKGPEVTFEMREDGEHVSKSSVTFQGLDDKLTVSFAFDRYKVYDAFSYQGVNLDLNVYVDGRAVDRFRIAEKDYHDKVDSHMRDGIIPSLRKAKFKGNADSLNKIIAEAQKVVLKKWPEYEKELHAKRVKQEQERISKTDEIGQNLQDKYGFLFENRKEKVKTSQEDSVAENKTISSVDHPDTNKLATLRKKIAHDIDETLETHLEEKKIAKPIKKIEKVISDKFFGKVNG